MFISTTSILAADYRSDVLCTQVRGRGFINYGKGREVGHCELVQRRSVWHPGWPVEYRTRVRTSHPRYFHRHLYLIPYLFFLLDNSFHFLTRHFSTERSDRWIGTIVLAKESYLETHRSLFSLHEEIYRFEDEHHLPREAGSAIAGRQVAAIEERRNVEEVSIPARLLLNCFALLRSFRFAPLSVSRREDRLWSFVRAHSLHCASSRLRQTASCLLKATWLVELDELRCGYSRAAKRDRNWFVSHRAVFLFRFVRLYLFSIASFSPHLASLSCLDPVNLSVFVSLFPSHFRSWLVTIYNCHYSFFYFHLVRYFLCYLDYSLSSIISSILHFRLLSLVQMINRIKADKVNCYAKNR